jgi:hypothetical protein
MCLAPKMPKPPEPPPPPPESVIAPGAQPTTIKTPSRRAALQQASKGTSSLTIPLSTGGATPNMSNLSIGNR